MSRPRCASARKASQSCGSRLVSRSVAKASLAWSKTAERVKSFPLAARRRKASGAPAGANAEGPSLIGASCANKHRARLTQCGAKSIYRKENSIGGCHGRRVYRTGRNGLGHGVAPDRRRASGFGVEPVAGGGREIACRRRRGGCQSGRCLSGRCRADHARLGRGDRGIDHRARAF